MKFCEKQNKIPLIKKKNPNFHSVAGIKLLVLENFPIKNLVEAGILISLWSLCLHFQTMCFEFRITPFFLNVILLMLFITHQWTERRCNSPSLPTRTEYNLTVSWREFCPKSEIVQRWTLLGLTDCRWVVVWFPEDYWM